MPVVVTETDTFPATLQRPSNGELADAASIQQSVEPLAKRTRYNYNRTRTRVFDVTRAPYNADPTGAADSLAAIVAAAADAVTAGGGDLFLPGTFRLSNTFSWPKGVSLRGVLGNSSLLLAHTTANLIEFPDFGPNVGPEQVVEGIAFIASAASTGRVFFDAGLAERNVKILGCSVNWNSGNLVGGILKNEGPSEYIVEDCHLTLGGNEYGLWQNHSDGRLVIRGGKILMPATFDKGLIVQEQGALTVQGVKIDMSFHSSGGPAWAIQMGGDRAQEILNNEFIGSIFEWGIGSFTGGSSFPRLQAKGNQFFGNVASYEPVRWGIGSDLDLNPLYAVSFVGTNYTIPAGISAFSINYAPGSGIANITMPVVLFPGQQLRLTVRNDSGSAWSGWGLVGKQHGEAQPLINSGSARSCLFVATDLDGDGLNYGWVQCGSWSGQFT